MLKPSYNVLIANHLNVFSPIFFIGYAIFSDNGYLNVAFQDCVNV